MDRDALLRELRRMHTLVIHATKRARLAEQQLLRQQQQLQSEREAAAAAAAARSAEQKSDSSGHGHSLRLSLDQWLAFTKRIVRLQQIFRDTRERKKQRIRVELERARKRGMYV